MAKPRAEYRDMPLRSQIVLRLLDAMLSGQIPDDPAAAVAKAETMADMVIEQARSDWKKENSAPEADAEEK